MEDQKETKATKETKPKSVKVESIKFITVPFTGPIGKSVSSNFVQSSEGFTIELLESGFIKLSRKDNPNHILVPLSNVANIVIKG